MKPRKIFSKEYLLEHCVKQRKTCLQIAKENNCAQSSVVYYLNKHNIQHRNRQPPTQQCYEANRKRLFKGCGDLGKF